MYVNLFSWQHCILTLSNLFQFSQIINQLMPSRMDSKLTEIEDLINIYVPYLSNCCVTAEK